MFSVGSHTFFVKHQFLVIPLHIESRNVCLLRLCIDKESHSYLWALRVLLLPKISQGLTIYHMETELVLRTDALCKSYKGVRVVDHVNMNVHKGDTLARILAPYDCSVLEEVKTPESGVVFFAHNRPLALEHNVIYRIQRL